MRRQAVGDIWVISASALAIFAHPPIWSNLGFWAHYYHEAFFIQTEALNLLLT
jgi:hypothetical protein